MELNDVKLDLNGSEDGVFFPFGEDTQIKIAQWGNKNHKKFLREIYTKHGRKIDAGALTNAQSDALILPQWVHIVKDWMGITENGEPLEYSHQILLDLAANPQYKGLFNKIELLAKEEENFRLQNIKDLGEDLPTT